MAGPGEGGTGSAGTASGTADADGKVRALLPDRPPNVLIVWGSSEARKWYRSTHVLALDAEVEGFLNAQGYTRIHRREEDAEARAAAGLALHPDRAPVAAHDAEDRRAYGANTGPHRIASAHRNHFQGLGQEIEAGDHRRHGEYARQRTAETIRVFEPHRPANFQ